MTMSDLIFAFKITLTFSFTLSFTRKGREIEYQDKNEVMIKMKSNIKINNKT